MDSPSRPIIAARVVGLFRLPRRRSQIMDLATHGRRGFSAGIDIYLSGHDHDLQLVQSDAGWLQVVSGGAKLRSMSLIDETIFAEETPGFCWLLVNESGLSFSFYGLSERRFTHTIAKSLQSRATKSLAALVPD